MAAIIMYQAIFKCHKMLFSGNKIDGKFGLVHIRTEGY